MSAPAARAPWPLATRLAGLALAACLWLPGQPAAARPAAPSPATTPASTASGLTLNFPDTNVAAVASVMADILGRPVVVDPRAKGKLSLRSEQPVSRAQALALFSSALRGLALAMVDSDGLLKIVPEAEAKLQAGSSPVDGGGRSGDPVLTQIFRPSYENAANLVSVLRPLISPNNTINLNAGNNSLVVTDYASNLHRIGQIIAALDTPSATDVEVIPLQHAVAADLAVTVARLSGDSSNGRSDAAGTPARTGDAAAGNASAVTGGASGGVTVLADAQLNALLVRAPNPARLATVRALVARLDQPGASGSGGSNVHVIYLLHAEATRLATVLRAAFSADALRALAGQAAAGGASSSGASGGSRSPLGSGTAGSAASGSASSSNSGASSSASTAAVSAAEAPATGGYIQADPATNALIITAPEPLFRQVRAVVDQLDTRRAQLYVESLVVEVDASKALDVGLQWKQIFNISSSTSLTLGTVAQAIESMSGTNILSTANLVTLDNEEAKIVVGQNVPFVTGNYTTTSGSTSSPFQTIERKDVGLTLRIRPQIGPGGAIRMSILQESSSVSSSTTPGTTNAGPTTNKRAIESTVLVGDGKIIVLGGLIEDTYTSDADQWPVLGELPLLGGLFRTLSRTRKKTNLMVFLRPTVMRDEAGTDSLSQDRYQHMRAQQQALPADAHQVLPGDSLPLLPATPAPTAPTAPATPPTGEPASPPA